MEEKLPDLAIVAKPSLFRGFLAYGAWWLIFGAIAGSAVPVVSPNVDGLMPDGYFAHIKLLQLLNGLVFGIASAIIFTVAQNAFNRARVKGRTWFLVFATWLIAKLIIIGINLAMGVPLSK